MTRPTSPRTLAEMQALSTDDFRQIDRYQYRGDVSKRKVIRHIIELAADELSWQGRQNANSLRDFWYNPTKAILERAMPQWGPGAGTSEWNREMSKRLSGVLSDMVKDGQITYRELNILDDSRDRALNPQSLESDKILFCEKSAAYRKLKPLETVYDISLVEGSGWQATALIEDMVHQFDTTDGPFTVWILTDYDPTGFDIARDFLERAQIFGLEIRQDTVDDVRIGVTPDQLDDDTIRKQAFSVSGSGEWVETWKQHYGMGEHGEFGLEIEAVGNDLEGKAEALRRLVVNEIRDEIREDRRRVQDVATATTSVGETAAENVFMELTGDLREALFDAAVSELDGQDGVSEAWVDADGDIRIRIKNSPVLDDETGGFIPGAYDGGVLHEKAVRGVRPGVDVTVAREALEEELREWLDTGAIDAKELLNV